MPIKSRMLLLRGILAVAFGVLGLLIVTPAEASTSLLTTTWHLVGNNSDAQSYQRVPLNILNGMSSLTITYNLHGLCARSGTDAALIFDQGGWKYVSLANYGTNCLDGSQTVTIPLSDFGVDTTKPLDSGGYFHIRLWDSSAFSVDISSVTLNPASSWSIQSVDMMKYTKDTVCGQPSQSTIDNQVQKATELGVNYVAIATPYDNPPCGNSLALTTAWVNSIRSHGLSVWHRHTALAFEGLYGVPKSRDKDFLTLMSNYITQNLSLFKAGDIFTPFPEPDSQGISGVTYCGSGVCQFQNAADFNQFIRDATLVANLSFDQIGLGGKIKVGYWGFSGFTVFGDANSDWLGKTQLEPSTVALMGNITMDEYPQNNNESMATALQGYYKVFPDTPLVIGEWGTIDATTSAQVVSEINDTLSAVKGSPNILGFNYWNLGPSGPESLIDSNYNNLPGFGVLQSFYK